MRSRSKTVISKSPGIFRTAIHVMAMINVATSTLASVIALDAVADRRRPQHPVIENAHRGEDIQPDSPESDEKRAQNADVHERPRLR